MLHKWMVLAAWALFFVAVEIAAVMSAAPWVVVALFCPPLVRPLVETDDAQSRADVIKRLRDNPNGIDPEGAP